MTLAFETITSAHLKELGPSDQAGSMTTYAYIEMQDGRVINKVEVNTALTGKLTESLQAGQSVDLHLMRSARNPDSTGLAAIKTSSGRLFAQKVPDVPVWLRSAVPIIYACGVITIPLLGLGLVLWAGRKLQKDLSMVEQLRTYVRGLPDAVLLG